MPANQPMRSRNNRLLKVIRNWFRSEVVGGATDQNPEAWVKHQLRQAVIEHAKGLTISDAGIEHILRTEVGKVLGGDKYSAKSKIEDTIRRIVKEEVHALIMQHLDLDVRLDAIIRVQPENARKVKL